MMKHLIRGMPLPYYEGEGQGSGQGASIPASAVSIPGAGTGSGGADPWYSTIDPSHHEWLRGKEFADPNIQVQSHRNLEAMLGRQRLAIPKDDKDADAYNAIYQTLGRPADAKGYKLPETVKLDVGVWDKFAAKFHELGISQNQAAGIVQTYWDIGTASEAEKNTNSAAQEAIQEEALKKEWGGQYDANVDLASRAFRSLGISEEDSNKVETALGFSKFMKLFHGIGKGMGEADFKTDTGGAPTGSVERAKAERDKLLADPEFLKRYQNSNQAIRNKAIEEIQVWMKIIADDKDARRGA